MEMFISFFTGKVMLFYGISLIMKEKSNASALLPETNASGPTFAKRHRHKIVDDKSLISIDCPSVLNL